MKRTRLALLLILAFLATFFAPLRASWACPDGTPCVTDRGHGFVCASDHCVTPKSCCEAERPLRCQHGALPAVERPTGSGPALEAPDHCRFSVSAPYHLVAVAEQSTKLLWLSFDLLPAPALIEFMVAAVSPTWQSEYTLGYRPPPSLTLGPSRAPPTA